MAADSKERTEVVPTAIIRPPRFLVALIASTTVSGTSIYSECITCSSIVSTFTG